MFKGEKMGYVTNEKKSQSLNTFKVVKVKKKRISKELLNAHNFADSQISEVYFSGEDREGWEGVLKKVC